MEKYITSIKDLVIESMRNDSQIQYQANVSKPEGCFKKGTIYLLGINTPIDFKKATRYFSNQSLANNQDANCLLGLIAEFEGNFSQAFHYYERIESNEKDSYLDKVIKGRNKLQNYLKKLDLPITNNKEISAILDDYSKGNASKVGACIKIAAICNDKESCLEAARAFYDSKDYISAIQWLQRGEIGVDNTLYVSIKEKFEKSKKELLNSREIQIIELDNNSLLSTEDSTKFLNKVKKTCEEASMKSSIEWKDKNKKRIDAIIRNQKNKEKKERLQQEAEEEARKKRRKKIIKYSAIAAVVLFFYILGSTGSSENGGSHKEGSGVEDVVDNGQSVYELHYFSRNTKLDHCFSGNFTDSKGVYPVELRFASKDNSIFDIVYKNVRLGGKIRMHCTKNDNNSMILEGKDGKNDFVISLSGSNNNRLIGVARVGGKQLDVELEAKCSH